MKPSKSSFLSIRGRRHHLRSWGADDAPLLIMLHGWGDVSATWQFVVDELRRDWRIVAPDVRGFGLSEGNDGTYWFAEYIADLDAVVEHLSPEAPVDLVGHSLGGNVVGLYAGIRPERVRRVVSLEGTGLPAISPEKAPQRFAEWLELLRGPPPSFRPYADFAEFAVRLRKDNPRLTAERADFMARALGETLADGTVRLAADAHHRWNGPILYRLEESKAIWRKITAPLLLITGAHSFFFSAFHARDSQEYRSRLECFANLTEHNLENSGHNMHHDEPEEVARLIEEFLSV